MPAIALWTPEDGLLGALAPLGAALAAPSPCLVVDLDPNGPPYPAPRSLADLVEEDPSEEDLRPRRGVAVLPNGGVVPSAAAEVVAALLDRWPRVVLRMPPLPRPETSIPVVPVRLLLSGWLAGPEEPGVWQATPQWVRLPGPGIRLPVPDRATVAALLRGRRPMRSRWISAWGSLWRADWGR